MTSEIVFSSATELAEAITGRRISAIEALDAHLRQIERHNAALNAVVTIDAQRAREAARAADDALARGENKGPLHGVPFTLKDAFATKGMRTTTGFQPFDHVPKEDSAVAARLANAGAILVGKTNVPVLLSDYQTANPIFGRTNNPWDVARTPGGSSGGAAAAVASGMTPFDIGSDLSASIRLPSHFCGVFGLKPTENRVSLAGVVPVPQGGPRSVRMMSCVGPIARSVDDLALLLSIIGGPDASDTDVDPVPFDASTSVPMKGLRIAFAPTFGSLPVATSIRAALENVARDVASAGATVDQPAMPAIDVGDDLKQAGQLIGMLTSVFQPDPDNPHASLADYFTALDRRDRSIVAWEKFLENWDALLCPASMTTAFPHCKQGSPIDVDGKQETYWAVAGHGTLFNYSGHPAVVLPCGVDENGLPIGVQLVGKRFGESRLLGVARTLTAVTGGFRRPPRD